MWEEESRQGQGAYPKLWETDVYEVEGEDLGKKQMDSGWCWLMAALPLCPAIGSGSPHFGAVKEGPLFWNPLLMNQRKRRGDYSEPRGP